MGYVLTTGSSTQDPAPRFRPLQGGNCFIVPLNIFASHEHFLLQPQNGIMEGYEGPWKAQADFTASPKVLDCALCLHFGHCYLQARHDMQGNPPKSIGGYITVMHWHGDILHFLFRAVGAPFVDKKKGTTTTETQRLHSERGP